MPSVTFEITVPSDPSKQQVVIVGTDRALGDWKPENGLVLDKRNGKFVGSADIPHGIVEFKITRGSWLTEATSRDGSLYPNSLYLVQHDMTISLEVENWNDSPPEETDLLNGKTVECQLHADLLNEHRQVYVWLPPGYIRSGDTQFPVLYLLNGQHALQSRPSPGVESLATDVWATNLARAGLMREVILVAVCHNEALTQRSMELSPQSDGQKLADFLVHDLKPFIDYTFCRDRTLADPANTGLLGFALGGLLALHMAQNHHHVFGKFACLSTSFQDLSEDTPDECLIIEQIRKDRTFKPDRKLYFDYGTLGPDARIEAYQQKLTKVLLAKNFIEDSNFKVFRAEGAEPSLVAWRARLSLPLQFLFNPGG
jgi:enterochelin esterase-like enzyme